MPRLSSILASLFLAWMLPVHAADSPFSDRPAAVADARLAELRGGFSTSDGLSISFGVSQAVYVNGVLVGSTSFSVANVGQAVSSAASTLVQSGAGNAARLISGAATVVQNTVDGQTIQSATTINASANSLGFYRNLNLGASLRGAVISSLIR